MFSNEFSSLQSKYYKHLNKYFSRKLKFWNFLLLYQNALLLYQKYCCIKILDVGDRSFLRVVCFSLSRSCTKWLMIDKIFYEQFPILNWHLNWIWMQTKCIFWWTKKVKNVLIQHLWVCFPNWNSNCHFEVAKFFFSKFSSQMFSASFTIFLIFSAFFSTVRCPGKNDFLSLCMEFVQCVLNFLGTFHDIDQK